MLFTFTAPAMQNIRGHNERYSWILNKLDTDIGIFDTWFMSDDKKTHVVIGTLVWAKRDLNETWCAFSQNIIWKVQRMMAYVQN